MKKPTRNPLAGKHSISFRLSDDARRILAALAAKVGVTQAAWLEFKIREEGKKEKVE